MDRNSNSSSSTRQYLLNPPSSFKGSKQNRDGVGGSGSGSGEAAMILSEFFEVAITSIVFLKGLYPSGAFERRRYMNLVVHQARHPQLSHYIHSSVSSLLPYIHKGLVDRVAVIFFDVKNVPTERFIFKLSLFNPSSNFELADIESALQSFLIKLQASGSLSKALSLGSRWEIMAYFRSLPETALCKDTGANDILSWIPTGMKQWQQPPLITPIKSISSEPLSLQLYMEHPSMSEPVDQMSD